MKAVFFSCLLAVFAFCEEPPKAKSLPYAPQMFRFDNQGVDSADGQQYSELRPYLPLSFGVVQLAGAKHTDKEVLICTPQMLQTDSGRYTKLVCDDGSEFAIAVIAFPRK